MHDILLTKKINWLQSGLLSIWSKAAVQFPVVDGKLRLVGKSSGWKLEPLILLVYVQVRDFVTRRKAETTQHKHCVIKYTFLADCLRKIWLA